MYATVKASQARRPPAKRTIPVAQTGSAQGKGSAYVNGGRCWNGDVPPADKKDKKQKKKKKPSFPTAFTILFALTIIAVIATWFVPAGQYAKLQYVADSNTLSITSPQGDISEVPATQDELDQLGVKIDIEQFTGGAITKAISIPGTYEQLDAQPKGIADITQAMVSGTIDGVDIMVFILVLGGLIGGERHGRLRIGPYGADEEDEGPRVPAGVPGCGSRWCSTASCGLKGRGQVAFYPPILVPVFMALSCQAPSCAWALSSCRFHGHHVLHHQSVLGGYRLECRRHQLHGRLRMARGRLHRRCHHWRSRTCTGTGQQHQGEPRVLLHL